MSNLATTIAGVRHADEIRGGAVVQAELAQVRALLLRAACDSTSRSITPLAKSQALPKRRPPMMKRSPSSSASWMTVLTAALRVLQAKIRSSYTGRRVD